MIFVKKTCSLFAMGWHQRDISWKWGDEVQTAVHQEAALLLCQFVLADTSIASMVPNGFKYPE